jgi:hypothetical protein
MSRGGGVSRASIPLKPKYGLNGVPTRGYALLSWPPHALNWPREK